MNSRSIVNAVRYVLENLLPPALRDSPLGYGLLWLYYGKNTRYQADFRRRAVSMSPQEYEQYYRTFPGFDTETDCNEACLSAMPELLLGKSVLDVGCGRGYVAGLLASVPDISVTGVDFIIAEGVEAAYPEVEFRAARIEALPFETDAFDTVVCTHTLEHIVDLAAAIRELRRVACRRLIIVVPQEREYLYNFNLHVHFFPYPYSFLKHMMPLPKTHHCDSLGGDILYWEDVSD